MTCPSKENVFKAFEYPISKVDIVIIGQDPYPDNRYATGIAFATPEMEPDKWPGSLKILAESIEKKVHPNLPYREHLSPTLNVLRFFGVMLINKSFTCIPGKPGSHENLWDFFTRSFIKSLSNEHPDLIYYLLGAKAKSLKENIVKAKAIFEDVHPSYVMRQRIEGKEASMTGYWKEISDLYEQKHNRKLYWFRPF